MIKISRKHKDFDLYIADNSVPNLEDLSNTCINDWWQITNV